MAVILKLAWRSVWRNRRRTLITTASISLSVALALFFLALAAGLYGNLVRGVARMEAGNLTVERPEYEDEPAVELVVNGVAALRARLEQLPGVAATKALVLGQGVARSGGGSAAALVMGVEAAAEARMSPLARKLVAGAYLADGDGRAAVVGAELAGRLGLSTGSRLVVSASAADGELVEQLFRVKGIFRTGAEDLDGHLVQIAIPAARAFLRLGPDQATRIGVLLDDGDRQATALADARAATAGEDLVVRPWQQVLPELAAFIRVDTAANYVMQGILLFLAGFTIFNTIFMSVLERRHEFGVMMAIGTTPRRVQAQVLLESAMVGLLGCAAGVALGGGAALWGAWRGIDLRSFLASGLDVGGFAVDAVLRPRLGVGLVLGLASGVIAAVIAMAIVPLRRIPRIPLGEVTR
jgi:ABC-type lipoprotein release transport system permease subunit